MSRFRNPASSARNHLWWLAYSLFVIFLVLPGQDRTPFSGLPLATRAQLLLLATIVLGLFAVLFPPKARTRWRWIVLLSATAVAKLVLAPHLVERGWKGIYYWPTSWTLKETALESKPFYQQGRIRGFRVDRDLNFNRALFGLHFANDPHPAVFEYIKTPRDIAFPLTVRWSGYTRDPKPAMQVTAHGLVTIHVDGKAVFRANHPTAAAVDPGVWNRDAVHWIQITYQKPAGAEPTFTLAGAPATVLPEPVFDALPGSSRAAGLVLLTGLAAMIFLAGAFRDAYPRTSRLVFEEIWSEPSRITALGLFVVFVGIGFVANVHNRHVTAAQTLGDDYLTYTAQSRQILQNGLLMTDREGKGTAYFHYPLYPYVLAGSSRLLGEDFGTVHQLNWLCLACVFLLTRRALRRRIAEGTLVAVMVALAIILLVYWVPYTRTAYSDNLYLPMVMGTLVLMIEAMESRRGVTFLLAGVTTALTAATRPSFLIFIPFAALAILVQRRLGSWGRRLKLLIAYVVGVASGISPFTARNYIVTGRFVLLVSSFAMLPMFLVPPEGPARTLTDQGQWPGAFRSVELAWRIIQEQPFSTAWLEFRKLAFTLGLTFFGPEGNPRPLLFILFPAIFAFAWRSRRIPWPVETTILAFSASHIAALVLAAPWTYGYKTIVPLHLIFLWGSAFLLPRWGESPAVVRDPAPALPESVHPKLSVVLPTYNEKDSIRRVIREFEATGLVDEILVINNNAVEGTSAEVAGTSAIEIMEPIQGYGAACQRGLREASGDYIVLCEPDGTFEPGDVHKLLAYAHDFDIVFGSRTSGQFVWTGANMGFFLRFGNWAVAKYMQVLFNGPTLTDVGCTMRLIKRQVARDLDGLYRIRGSQFGPEMMVLALQRHRGRVVQIPVNYKPRVGESSVTGDPSKAFTLGLQMIALVTRHAMQAARSHEVSASTEDVTHISHAEPSQRTHH